MPTPPEIEPLWATLYDEVVSLHAYWIIFEQLFGKSRVRYELLYASARNLFLVVEDGIGTDIQLTLAKLSDPPAMGGYQNATLSRLLEDVARIRATIPWYQESSLIWQSSGQPVDQFAIVGIA